MPGLKFIDVCKKGLFRFVLIYIEILLYAWWRRDKEQLLALYGKIHQWFPV